MDGRNNQLVGNTGLFYICYELSKKGWKCLITSRNAKGPDIIIYSQDGERKYAIQAKSLRSRENSVPFGSNPNFISDYLIICVNVFENPEIYIFKTEDVKNNLCRRAKNGKISYWFKYNEYRELAINSI
ncbi:MAG TPA: hypothetical protein PLB98_02120 [bacterium]|nr:hypothetical protein [bacterium]HRV05173.1 hypothetical protein [Candidatus Ratteibacteria bacterium]